MASPLKPWEKIGTVNRNLPNAGINHELAPNSFSSQSSHPPMQLGNPMPPRPASQLPPPLPPRRQPQPVSRTSPFGTTQYGGYGYPSMPYGSYSTYGSSIGGYGLGRLNGFSSFSNDPYATSDYGFIQLAEESSRPAFQSIESVVHAVGSVSMMLESTYFAMHSSFRAVIGVAHHFSQMKSQFARIFSALALIRGLKWLYQRALYLLGMNAMNGLDSTWTDVARHTNASSLSENDLKQPRSNWPFIMFVAIVFGAPWLIWKVLMSVTSASKLPAQHWLSGAGEHYVAVAQFDFAAESEREISLRAGQKMRLAPKELQPRIGGWLLASVNGQKAGLVPVNYVQILGRRSPSQQHSDSLEAAAKHTDTTINSGIVDSLTEDFLKEQS